MKFISLAIAAVAALTTVSARLAPCDLVHQLEIHQLVMVSAEGKQCTADTQYDLLVEAIAGKAPAPEQYATICGSTACKAMLNKLYTEFPEDCQVSSGASFKSLLDPVYNACKA